MKTWVIEPRDPLIARDGRPFTADPGARAKSLPFPFPSTTAGTVRTRYGFTLGDFNDETQKRELIRTVKQITVQGPLLVELNNEGEIKDWLLPAPVDAVLFEAAQNRLTSNNSLLCHCPKECTPICRMTYVQSDSRHMTQLANKSLSKTRRASGRRGNFSTGSAILAIGNQSNSINSVMAGLSRNPAFT